VKRITQLDGARGVAIHSVCLHYALHIKLLWAGVDLFFILSGFTGVLRNARTTSLGPYFANFYARRARWIVIPYIVALLLMSIFFGFAWTGSWYFYLGLTNFLMPLNIPHPTAFDPLWSLAIEEQFYLVWPFAVYFLSKGRGSSTCRIEHVHCAEGAR
jgi:peptidoglycan/LPS O-acetylase OafA/YrhL